LCLFGELAFELVVVLCRLLCLALGFASVKQVLFAGCVPPMKSVARYLVFGVYAVLSAIEEWIEDPSSPEVVENAANFITV
jgi:hypothetical protein